MTAEALKTPEILPETEAFRQVRHQHASETAQDYVEAVADLIEEHGEARAVDLARKLGVTHVTVSQTVGRLQKSGLIQSQPYRSIFLTDEGRELAAKCKARHLVIVDFLKKLGVSSDIAIRDAEGIEHHVSEETLAAMQAFSPTAG